MIFSNQLGIQIKHVRINRDPPVSCWSHWMHDQHPPCFFWSLILNIPWGTSDQSFFPILTWTFFTRFPDLPHVEILPCLQDTAYHVREGHNARMPATIDAYPKANRMTWLWRNQTLDVAFPNTANNTVYKVSSSSLLSQTKTQRAKKTVQPSQLKAVHSTKMWMPCGLTPYLQDAAGFCRLLSEKFLFFLKCLLGYTKESDNAKLAIPALKTIKQLQKRKKSGKYPITKEFGQQMMHPANVQP